MKPLAPFVALCLIGCAHQSATHITAPSTAGVRSSVSQAQDAARQAQEASARSSGHVKSAREDSDRLSKGLDAIDYDAKQIRRIMNGGGHP